MNTSAPRAKSNDDALLSFGKELAKAVKETATGNGIASEPPRRAIDRKRAGLDLTSAVADIAAMPFGFSGFGVATRVGTAFLAPKPPPYGEPEARESLLGSIRSIGTGLAVGAGYAVAYATGLPWELGALVALPTAIVDARDLINSYRR